MIMAALDNALNDRAHAAALRRRPGVWAMRGPTSAIENMFVG